MQANLVGVSLATAPGKACYVPLGHKASGGGLFGGDAVPGQIRGQGSTRPPEAAARGSGGAEDRPEPEIRHRGAGAARHRRRADRRHHADVLCARVGRCAAMAWTSSPIAISATSRSPSRRWPVRQVGGHLRPRGAAPRHRLCGGGRRRDAAALAAAQAASRGDGQAHRLRDAGAAAGAGAGAHGDGRHHRRPRRADAALERVRHGGGRDRDAGLRAGGRALQHRLAQAAGRHALRPHGPARRPQDGDRRLVAPTPTRWRISPAQGVELARRVLDWRQLSKLRSTYTDALPGYINPQTGRVHTSYSMAATSTGRLASTEPNLQNIPVRTEEGRKIRAAFVAPPGIEADQRRLQPDRTARAGPCGRHPAAEEGLRRRHRHPRHDGVAKCSACRSRAWTRWCGGAPRRSTSASSTASRPSAWPTSWASRARRRATTSRPISSASPASAITWKQPKQAAREQGYVETIFGRRCHFPRINSPNPSERAFLERAAINAPIQGAAADIIRRAMIRMDDALAACQARRAHAAAGA